MQSVDDEDDMRMGIEMILMVLMMTVIIVMVMMVK